MVKKLQTLFLFYKKLMLPTLPLAILGSAFISGLGFYRSLAFVYFIFSLFMHFIIYERRNKDEYYFYFNLGFSKPILWLATFLLSLLVSFVLLSLKILVDNV